MVITKLTFKRLVMKGFRVFKDEMEIRFNDYKTIIEADNLNGKTSIAEGLLWGFFGVNLEGNDKVDHLLMNKDSNKMKVLIEYECDGLNCTLERERIKEGNKTKILLNGKKIRQMDLDYSLGGSKEYLMMSLNLDYFFKLSEKQQRDFISSLLPEVSSDEVLKSLTEFEASLIANDIDDIDLDPNRYLRFQRSKIKELEDTILKLRGRLEGIDIDNYVILEKKQFDDTKLKKLEKERERLLSLKPDTEHIVSQIEHLNAAINKINTTMSSVKSSSFRDKLKDDRTLLKESLKLQNEIRLLEKEQYKNILEKDILKLGLDLEQLRKDYKREKIITVKAGDDCPTCRRLIEPEHIDYIKMLTLDRLNKIHEKAKGIIQNISDLEEKEEINKRNFMNKVNIKLNNKKELLNNVQNELLSIEEYNRSIEKDFKSKQEEKIQELNSFLLQYSTKLKELELEKKDIEERFEEAIGLNKRELFTSIEKQNDLKMQVEKYNFDIEYNNKNFVKNKKMYEEITKQINDKKEEVSKLKTIIDSAQNYIHLKSVKLADLIKEHFNKLTVSLQKYIKSTGEIKDCFEIIYNGQNIYSLSNACSEKMRIALEIYDFIMSTKGIQFPLFLDNAESISHYDTKAHQIIEAKVNPNKTLQNYKLNAFDQTNIHTNDFDCGNTFSQIKIA